MKVSVNKYIAVVVLSLVFFGEQAFADDKKVSKNTQMLAGGKRPGFEEYVLNNFTAFTEQEDWKIFVEIVTYYNNEPSKLWKIKEAQQQQFNNAVYLLKHTMKESQNAEAKEWLERVDKAAKNISFLWRTGWDDLTPAYESAEGLIGEPIGQLNGF